MAFVLDASSALPWCFADEATAGTEALRRRAQTLEMIYVPAHWPLEILNGVTRAARRGRVQEPFVNAFLFSLASFHVVVDNRSIAEQWSQARALILRHRLSGYDAGYLSLARSLNLPLATLDARLQQAALVEGVTVLL